MNEHELTRNVVRSALLTVAVSVERGNSNSEEQARSKVQKRYEYFLR